MSRSPLPPLLRQEVEERLRRAKTKREMDALVSFYRTLGLYDAADREALDAFAEEQAQRFADPHAKGQGARVGLGRFPPGFRNVARGR